MSKAGREKGVTPYLLQIHLLGPFRIMVDGVPVEERHFTRRKPKLLVKLLALQPHHQLHREQAIEFLWPDADPESAINNLHKVIHLARHALEPALKSASDSHFIHTQGQQVLLRAPDVLWIDVEAFEQSSARALKGGEVAAYEEALALYRGDLLTEDPYEDWAAARREQLRTQYQDLLGQLAQLYESRGEYQRAIEQLKALVACDPPNEEAHRELMRLYAATRHRRQALRQYEECREALRRDLDAEPERATVELREQIVAGRIPPLPGATAARAPQPSAAINSVAILPLVNVGGDPNTEYLSDGITESIINTLSQLPQLRVMARSTVFRYKGVEVDPQEVGSRLGVRAVLTGRVLQRGDALNIQTELVDVSDGSQLWGAQYNRNSSGIFAVQEEIAKELAGKLRLRLSGEEQGQLTKRHTENAEAYRLYLKGRYFWNKRTVEGVNRGIDYFQQAIKIDPGYAAAYTGLADCYAKLGDVGTTAMPSKEAFLKGKMAAVKALEIDGALAEAHTSLAHFHLHDYKWSEAEREFKRALELNPNYATAHHWYAYCLLMVGRPDEALTEIARALELDPLSIPINNDFGDILYFARRYDRAIEQLQKTLEMDPQYLQARVDLARIYEQKGMYKEAVADFLKAKELSADNVDVLASLAHTFAVSGEREEASKVLARLKELSKRKYVSPYNLAVVYTGLGEKDKVFEWLHKACEEHAEWMIYLTLDPRFDPLRADPRFKELLRRIGFAP